MLLDYYQQGGPLMVGVALCWVLILTLILDRTLYWLGAVVRRPIASLRRDLLGRRYPVEDAESRLEGELRESRRNLEGLSSLSQLATSVGLFGTVFGLCRSFLDRAAETSVQDSVVTGLSTALLTTIGGLSVFLVGQVFLIVFQGLTDSLERRGRELLETAG